MIFKKKKVEKINNISQGKIKVRVYMRFGAEVRQRRAEYFATEKRDGYNNLVALSDNEEIGHNEDVDFTQENVYSAMKTTLGISNLQKDEALEKLEEEIARYNKRIKAINKHPELNKFANIWDEKRRLRELEIYKKYTENRSENGAYFKLEESLRVYEYESLGGFLIPIWHGVDNMVDYPDFTNKKKITMQETANIHKFFDSKGVKKMLISSVMMLLIINALLFCVLTYSGFKLWDKSATLDDQINACAIQSAKTTLETVEVFNQMMRNPFIQAELENKNAETNQSIQSQIQELIPN